MPPVTKSDQDSSREIARLKKVNQELRRDVKFWQEQNRNNEAMVARLLEGRSESEKQLRKEIDKLRREMSEYHAWKRDRDLDAMFAALNRLAGPRTVSQVLRKASMEFHPDRGGTDEQMAVVNKIRELLEELLAPRSET
jgi:hypothetical protein